MEDMTKGFAKVMGVLVFLLFIGGTILLPAIHRAHCSENHATHEAGTCPICQFANTPAITTSPAIAPIGEPIVCDNVEVPVSTVPALSLRDATQARAPPVA